MEKYAISNFQQQKWLTRKKSVSIGDKITTILSVTKYTLSLKILRKAKNEMKVLSFLAD